METGAMLIADAGRDIWDRTINMLLLSRAGVCLKISSVGFSYSGQSLKYTTILDAALHGQSPAACSWPGAGCALWPCDHRPVPCQVRSAASTPHFLQPQIWDVFVIALASGDCMTPTMRRCLLLTFHWPPLKLGYMRQFRIFLAPGAKVQTS